MGNQNTKVKHELAEPGTGKDCIECMEHLTTDSFYRVDKRCRWCYNKRNKRETLGSSPFLQFGPPLKVRVYTPVVINGVTIMQPGERVSGT